MSLDVAANAASGTLRRAVVEGASQITISRFFNDSFGVQWVFDETPSGPYTLDAANLLLPDYATRPAYDAASRSITWTPSNGVTPDYTFSWTSFDRQDGTSSRSWRWEIVAPYADGKLEYPRLPGTRRSSIRGPATGSRSTSWARSRYRAATTRSARSRARAIRSRYSPARAAGS